jgi:hypothetical protein
MLVTTAREEAVLVSICCEHDARPSSFVIRSENDFHPPLARPPELA